METSAYPANVAKVQVSSIFKKKKIRVTSRNRPRSAKSVVPCPKTTEDSLQNAGVI